MFGSIWCVYAFTMFSLIPLLLPKAQNMLLYVSNCIQLVALPALMVGSALLAKNGEQRAAQDHDALLEILGDVREELATLKALGLASLPAGGSAPGASAETSDLADGPRSDAGR